MSATNRLARLFPLVAALALVLAACGGTASPSPAASSATPTPSAEPTPSTEPSESAEPSGEGPDLSGAASALDDLTSYQIDIEISGIMPTASGASGITMSAIVDVENDAVDFTMSGFEGLPTAGAGLRVIVIGDDAWLDLGSGAFIPQPGGASTYGDLVTQLSPSNLLGGVPTGAFEFLPSVGQEQKNGVAATHYHVDGTNPAFAAQLGADGSTDVWIADDGDYLVSMEVSGTTVVSGASTTIEMKIDLSRIDDPTIDIQPPS